MTSLYHRCSCFLWLSLLCCFLTDAANSNVEIEVSLTRFSNPQHRNALKQCCDGKKDAVTCTDSCDIFFVVCVHPPQCVQELLSDGILRNASEFISSQRNFSLSSGITHENFPSVTFKVNLKIFTTFSIRFYDDDSVQGKPSLANRSSYEKVINFTQILATPINSSTLRRNLSKDNISLEILYRLKCADNLYGERCDTHCFARDDMWGHTKCLENGTKICLSGWKGPDCKTPICPSDCYLHGRCDKPGSCSCNPGWKGPTCTECIPHAKCLHATCTDPHQSCDCKKNWTGQYCNILADYCSHYKPCKNGQCYNHISKNFTCTCFTGWTGRKCEKSLCPASCNRTNAVCKRQNECSCKAGWQGTDCNQCIPKTNCTHGYCMRPFECLCEEGWRGDKCDETTRSPNCSQRNPCQNDGTCVDIAMDDYQCLCKRGFTGRHCQDKDPCSIWCNEEQGYCQNNECRCYDGWQGPNCTECVRNSSCVNGYCRQPFQCLCNKSWTGPFCNISINECSPGNNSSRCSWTGEVGSDESSSDMARFIYIVSSLLVVLLVVCILCILWRQYRRRATFHVQSPGVVVNNIVKPWYRSGDGHKKNMLSLNNNVSAETDFKNYPANSEILLNPMTLQPSQNSRSTLLSNGPEMYESSCILSNDKSPPNSAEYCIIEQALTNELLK